MTTRPNSRTLTLPSGSTVRTASSKRYAVVAEFVTGSPRVLQRTNDARIITSKALAADVLVYDLVTGERVR